MQVPSQVQVRDARLFGRGAFREEDRGRPIRMVSPDGQGIRRKRQGVGSLVRKIWISVAIKLHLRRGALKKGSPLYCILQDLKDESLLAYFTSRVSPRFRTALA